MSTKKKNSELEEAPAMSDMDLEAAADALLAQADAEEKENKTAEETPEQKKAKTPEEQLENQERKNEIHACVNQLPEPLRQVVHLIYYEMARIFLI